MRVSTPSDAAPTVEVEATRPFTLDQVGVDRLGDPFQLQPGHVLHVERTPHLPVGVAEMRMPPRGPRPAAGRPG